jgi:hypothetical protein
VLLTLPFFFIVKYHVIATPPYATFTLDPGADSFAARVFLIVLLALAGISIKAEQLDTPIRRFLRVLLVLVAAYAMFAAPTLTPEQYPDHAFNMTLLQGGAYLAPVLGVLAWWRPLLGLPVVALLFWQKSWLPYLNDGLGISLTDFLPLFDTLLFLLLALLAQLCLSFSASWKKQEAVNAQEKRASPAMVAFFMMIGVHFSNYFHSGIAKIVLDGGPFTWLLENRTDYLARAALEMGQLPIAVWPQLTSVVLSIIAAPAVLFALNAFTLFSQLLCPLSVISKRLVLLFLVLFDVLHVGIFALTGIFFWKWIALNTAFVIALTPWQAKKVPAPSIGLMLIFSMLPVVVPGLNLPSGYQLSSRFPTLLLYCVAGMV